MSSWGPPRASIEAECRRRGKDAVVAGCIDLLSGGDADDGLVLALGGPAARWILHGAGEDQRYWLRVWAARGLLWAWDDAALGPIVAALSDEAWRVREMSCKVVARHRLGDAMTAVTVLRDDAVLRVRAAAQRALVLLTEAGA